jgi:hypothetical protein
MRNEQKLIFLIALMFVFSSENYNYFISLDQYYTTFFLAHLDTTWHTYNDFAVLVRGTTITCPIPPQKKKKNSHPHSLGNETDSCCIGLQ